MNKKITVNDLTVAENLINYWAHHPEDKSEQKRKELIYATEVIEQWNIEHPKAAQKYAKIHYKAAFHSELKSRLELERLVEFLQKDPHAKALIESFYVRA